ncbi:hypothetical protein RND81_03G178100 [Saponaria officinalis]|uniref:Uncharacterized protein n=1 Tax=Saponaria officinalis TaxID=3572 RepID=A0AAW1M105_SAPOF
MAKTIENLQLTLDPISLILNQFSNPLNSNHNFQLLTDSYFIERGLRYNAYAQLRESKLQSKRLQLDEIELFSEIPTSVNSPSVKKSVKFHANLCTSEQNEQVSAIPRPNFLRKSVKFQEISSKCEENVRVSEKPTSEYSSPMKKSVKFQGNKQGSSTPRKENRKPTPENNSVGRIHRAEKCTTPPASSLAKREKMYDTATNRSKSVNSGEKQRMMILGRKSCASIEELKGLSIAACNAINGETKGAKKNHLLRKSTVFSTKFY